MLKFYEEAMCVSCILNKNGIMIIMIQYGITRLLTRLQQSFIFQQFKLIRGWAF